MLAIRAIGGQIVSLIVASNRGFCTERISTGTCFAPPPRLPRGQSRQHGEIKNISERGTQIWLDQPLHYASLVRIDYNDNLLLGEVVYCKREQAGWVVGIHAEHALFGLTALARALSGH